MLVVLERKRQGWDKAEFGKFSGLERQGRDQDKRNKATTCSSSSPFRDGADNCKLGGAASPSPDLYTDCEPSPIKLLSQTTLRE